MQIFRLKFSKSWVEKYFPDWLKFNCRREQYQMGSEINHPFHDFRVDSIKYSIKISYQTMHCWIKAYIQLYSFQYMARNISLIKMT